MRCVWLAHWALLIGGNLAMTMQPAGAGMLPAVGRSAEELLQLRLDDYSTTMTTRLGEIEIRTLELAALDRKLALPPGAQAEKELPGAMWTSLLFNARHDRVREILREYLPQLHLKPQVFQQYLLYAAYQLMPEEAARILIRVPISNYQPRELAIVAYTILKGTRGAPDEADIRNMLRYWVISSRPENDPTFQFDPRLEALLMEIGIPREEQNRHRPPLEDLLAWEYHPALPVLFSLQRVDRRQPGLAVIRDSSGRFLRDPDGTLFNIPQLAHARTDLPGTITNGNTPQGIYTIVGTGTASNRWIGPTVFLWSKIPHEASVSEFLHRHSDLEWNVRLYSQMMPPSWRGYVPFEEAWLAGLAGRSEMLCHGTTISSDYYIGEPYHPFTPSAGCLVTIEEWHPETGLLTRSDQLTLVQAFVRAGGPRGHMVVVELDSESRPVSLNEVEQQLLAAEAALQQARAGAKP
jgi:hypothetical protein